MKKIAGIIIKTLLGLVILILVLLFTIPIIFKAKIKDKVENVINESVNASVKFEDYNLGFFKNFPNLSFSLKNMTIVGKDKFTGDTLAGFKSFNLVFNLGSLISKSGYEVKSIIVDQAVVNAIVLKDGSANWDIMKDTTQTATSEVSSTSSSSMKILLKKVEILNSAISYVDKSSFMEAYLKNFNFALKGDMTMNETDLQMVLHANKVTFIMDGVRYLNNAIADSKMDLYANLDSMKFTFRQNYLAINDLKLNFSGTVAMPGNNIKTDLLFGTEKTSFKTLLSLVPAIYMNDYKDLKASGEFTMTGSAKGVYSDTDSTMPDITLALAVTNGLISYPELPEQIKNINISSNVFIDGRDMDKTTVSVDKFHLELAGSPFDMTFFLKTPLSDPDFRGSVNGRIDLTALSKAVPMDSIKVSGVLDMAVSMAGRLSMIEKEHYEQFKAEGTMGIKNMMVAMTGYPEVKVIDAVFTFTPAYSEMQKADLMVGNKSDFSLSGRLENYIPYVFKNEAIRGNMKLHSKVADVSEIMAGMSSDTSAASDTTSLSLITIPKNIDFNLSAVIDKLIYDNIIADNLKGRIIIKDGVLSLKETNMNILGGDFSMNADYDTRDTSKPMMKADFNMRNMGVKDAFTTFVTVQKLAPGAKGINGKINVQFAYQSLLGRNMMPVLKSINGSGKLQSDEITLVESATFDKLRGLLKLGDKSGNVFKNINISFKINDGRVFVSPFDLKLSNVKMNVSGDQGLDQTLNYLIKTEIPRADLGTAVNSIIDNLSANAASLGVKYKPSDVIKVNVKVSGTFAKPEISPVFGGTSEGGSGTAKEGAKEVAKQVITDAVDKAREKVRGEAQLQAEKLVKEAEVKAQQLRDEAASAAVKIRQEADVQAQNLIKGAESKGMLAKAAAQKGADVLKKQADKQANQVIKEADDKSNKLVEEAKNRKETLTK